MQQLKKAEQALFFLAILFLPTQLGKHFWPDFSYVYSLKIDYLSPTIYFWDILVIFLLVVALINRLAINRIALNLYFFFIFTQILSLVNSANIGAGLFRLEQFFISGFFGIYLASMDFKSQISKVTVPLMLAVAFQSLLGVAQVLKGGSVGFWVLGERSFVITTPAIAKFDFYGMELLRPYATFPHPNVLAAFLLLATLFLSLFSQEFAQITNGSRYKRGITRVAIFLSGITAVLTFSRVALLLFLFSAIFFLRKKMLILIFVLVLLISPLLFARYSSLFNYDSLTVLRRTELAEKSFEYFIKSPIFGVGLNNFIPTLSYDMVSGPNRFLQPVHNIFLLSLSETGIIGLIGLFVLIAYPLLFKIKDKKWLVIWGVTIFLGMFDHYFLTIPQGYRMLFLLWGLSISRVKIFK